MEAALANCRDRIYAIRQHGVSKTTDLRRALGMEMREIKARMVGTGNYEYAEMMPWWAKGVKSSPHLDGVLEAHPESRYYLEKMRGASR